MISRFLDWLFPIRLSPWRECTNCGDRKAKERMINDLFDWFCDENCQDKWAKKVAR
jgi:hypothetical protein